MTTYQQLVANTEALCKKIENDPEQRYAVPKVFYAKHKVVHSMDYGRSELDFLRWEIDRGVFAKLDASKPGSRWWRDVNLNFIFLSELAGAMFDANVRSEEAPMPTKKWLTFLEEPSPQTWYRAHNSSILAGFDKYIYDGKEENPVEQLFLNIILYRLMFAQALVEDATIFGEIGEWIADPRGLGVDFLIHQSELYPRHYPLTKHDRRVITGHGFKILENIEIHELDDKIIKPNIVRLYTEAANWNDSPFLLDYLKEGEINYPCPLVK